MGLMQTKAAPIKWWQNPDGWWCANSKRIYKCDPAQGVVWIHSRIKVRGGQWQPADVAIPWSELQQQMTQH